MASKVLITFPWSGSRRQIFTGAVGGAPVSFTVNVFAAPGFGGGGV